MIQSLLKLARVFLDLPRVAKRVIALFVDCSLCIFTLWLAYYLRLGEFVALSGAGLWAVLVSVILALPIFIISGLYRAIFRYNGWPALLAVARAVGLYGILYAAIFTAIGVPGVPRTVGIIQPILLLLFVGGSRAFVRLWLGGLYQNRFKQFNRPKVFIYGAGQTGRALAAAMHNNRELQVVGFLDDDHRLHGHILNGLRIYNPDKLLDLIAELSIQDILLAMPNMARKRRNDMLEKMRVARVSVRTLPSLTELAQGKITISDVRELDLDDLLGREPVPPNALLLRKNINQKVVLVTGAGGSIGSELCRQIVSLDPEKLLLIDQSEFALYAIHQELEAKLVGKKIILIPLLASVRDEDRMHEILSTWKPHTVYHAAAYKHVPLVEHNPAEGLKNNVLGTLKMAKAAAENDVSDFVLISTDKAVRPTNIMGGSKRMAELVLQALANQKNMKTKFTMVRFGNVLGSAGSVVPKFRQQIRAGGPVTLTHPEITRYFMTIPEAAQLVIQAGAMSAGGDVFLLEMGKPVKIMDLARRMIELSGLTVKDSQNPEGDIEIEITGLRPAEKLYEELLIGENPQPTSHPRIMKAHEDFMAWEDLEPKLSALEAALNVNDVNAIRSMIHELVPGYIPSEIVDWVHLAHDTHLS